ncbi:azurin [Leptobacterium flavescens]|uniref:Azurin n=1 Tax=Leptobacterium flavescens TaxID=472055 RepID=A0A6P0UMF8_9FLAO|nr:azurin [Leptobacterium flavescens]NER14424.1 azurin [Leptobacterium flavescens]
MKNLHKAATIVVFSLLISCGGKEEKKEGFQYDRTKKTETSKEDKTSNNIVLVSDDLMKFNLKEIRVKAGQKVTLTLKHTGKLDKKIMGHNFVLLTQGTDLVSFATVAATARDNEYIPENTTEVIVHTKLIGGGETDVIEFEAPAKGTYDFLCSFPGHYGLMQGKFIVE